MHPVCDHRVLLKADDSGTGWDTILIDDEQPVIARWGDIAIAVDQCRFANSSGLSTRDAEALVIADATGDVTEGRTAGFS